MKLNQAISIRITKLLNTKGLRQRDLFKLGGIPRPTISSVVNATRENITLSTVYQISSALGMTLAEFFSDDIFSTVTD